MDSRAQEATETLVAGRYRLLEELGRGGFGTVWRARNEQLGGEVALKLLNPEVAHDEEARKRFLREVEAARSFVHKYAVQVRDAGMEPSGQLYFTMDLVPGRTLRAVLDAEGPLAPGRVAQLGAQVCEALAEAHAAGIVHRDLKPLNLIVTEGRSGEEIRVLDFGIAKAVKSAHSETSGLTVTGTTIGTLRYMSPEQAQGKRLDGRSDLYTLCVVLFEALSGKLPIEADPDAEDTRQSLSWKLVHEAPLDLAQVAPEVPGALRDAVMRGLEKQVADRPADAAALRLALLAWESSPPAATSAGAGTASFQATAGGPVAGGTASFGLTEGRPVAEASPPARQPAAPASPPAPAPPEGARAARGRPPTPASRSSSVGPLLLGAALLVGGVAALDPGGVRTALLERLRPKDEPARPIPDPDREPPAPQPAAQGPVAQETGSNGPGPSGPPTEQPPTDAQPIAEQPPPQTEPGPPADPQTEPDPQPPAPAAPDWRLVEITPADGTATRELVIDVTGRLEPAGPGQASIAGIPRPVGPDGRFRLEKLGLQPGRNELRVRVQPARPPGADQDPPAVERTLVVTHDLDPPALTVAPQDGAETREDALPVAIDVQDATAVSVTLDGAPVQRTDSGAWQGEGRFQGRLALPRYGARRFVVVARDAAGNERRLERQVTRVAPALALTLDEPADGLVVQARAERLRVAGQVRGEVALSAIEVRVQGVAAPLGPDGRFAVLLPLTEGAHALEAVARATAPGGEVTARAGRGVLLDDTPPVLRVTSPADGTSTTEARLELAATIEDVSPWVEVELAGRTLRVPRGAPLRAQVELQPGENTITLGAVDAAKNRAAQVRVRVRRETTRLPAGLDRLPPGIVAGAREGEWINQKDGTVLVWVPAGTFRMGSDNGDSDEKPVHEVRFAKGFFLGKYETTWKQYRAFCQATGRTPPEAPSGAKEDHPVVNVSWEDARAYCEEWAGLRLPSEAEWEYACRASSTGDGQLGEYAWYDSNSGRATHPVGQKKPNTWGLHDMHGNVWEWCQDWYRDSYQGAPSDGSAVREQAGSSGRVFRGGGWGYGARYCRAAGRHGIGPAYRRDDLGFRPAR